MRVDTLDILRCPFCGGRLELVTSLFHRREGDEIRDGILGCHCCIFPVVDGIPIMHLTADAGTAREHLEGGRPEQARLVMFGLHDEAQAALFARTIAAPDATYRAVVEALGPAFEGGYFLYRFSDPTYVVAEAVVRAVAGTVLAGRGRAVDICGGSGHLTRVLTDLSPAAPVLADLYFAKLWLARRFTAPGCEAVCCDGNAPMPFARGAFDYAMCSDAFQYIWTKRLFVGEMARLVDRPGRPGAVVINHSHDQLAWSPSHGQPLSAAVYRDLFETLPPRVFGETVLFADVVAGGPLNLARMDEDATLDADPALTVIATTHPDVFQPHAIAGPASRRGEYRWNPLYAVEPDGERLRLRLGFPNTDYEDEYGACRRYLPDELVTDASALAELTRGTANPALLDLIRRRVVVDLPLHYY